LKKEEAIKLAKSGWWKNKSPEEIVRFQLYEDRLCMDFGDFHEAIEKALGRPVWTHEFARPEDLRREFEKKDPKRTVEKSMKLVEELAEGKPIIYVAEKKKSC